MDSVLLYTNHSGVLVWLWTVLLAAASAALLRGNVHMSPDTRDSEETHMHPMACFTLELVIRQQRCTNMSLVTGFCLSSQQSGLKWWNVINFYLRFVAFAEGNRTIASSYWGNSKNEYAVKKLDYNSLRGSHTPWTSGTPWMLLDIEVNLNWVNNIPLQQSVSTELHYFIDWEQIHGIKIHKA